MIKYNKNKRKQVTIIVIVALLLLGIGYAALTTVLKIHTNITLKKVEFAIHFDNVGTANNNADVNSEAAIIDDPVKREIMFNAQLNRIDDYYAFTTDIVNEGSIPGVIKSIEIQGITDSQKKLLKFDVRYTDSNKEMKIGDYLGPNSSKNITFKAIYSLADDINDEDLPDDDLSLEGVFVINFENGSLDVYRSRAAASKLMQDTNYMSSSALNFSKATSSLEYSGAYILDSTVNDDFPIYFYRGGQSTPNNVLFAGYCWRIIRTTDTGGIKIIYNGNVDENGQCNASGSQTEIGRTSFYRSTALFKNNNIARTYLSSWYFANLIDYQAYLEDTVFCNNVRQYDASVDVSLSCDPEYQVSVAKGTNSYPIGLITAQEANLCGQVKDNTQTGTYGWLYTNSDYWTMTMYNKASPERILWIINQSGWIYGNMQYVDSEWQNMNETHGMRPVVSLNSEVELYDGDGTKANPYKVRLG